MKAHWGGVLFGLMLAVAATPAQAQRQQLNCWGCVAGRCQSGIANGTQQCREWFDGENWNCVGYGGECPAIADSNGMEQIPLTDGRTQLAIPLSADMYVRPSCDGAMAALFVRLGSAFAELGTLPLSSPGRD